MYPSALNTLTIALATEADTEQLGQALACATASQPHSNDCTHPAPHSGGRIHLQGELGAGKTSLVRAFLRHSGVTGRIKSPSYALLESYKVSSLYLYHLDFYRFSSPTEYIEAGFRDLLDDQAIVLIEWPERAGELLSYPDLLIELAYADQGRLAVLQAYTARVFKWIEALSQTRTNGQAVL